MRPSRDDVVACYRRLLGREPENEEVVQLQLRIADDIWTLVTNFTRSDEFAAIAGRRSAFSLLKSFSPDYLAKGLSQETRTACVAYNYAALQAMLSGASLVALMERGLPILEGLDGFPQLRVDMLLFAGPADEGEISLIVSVANRRTAVLTYTVAPGAAFDLPDETVFLVSRLQGYIGVREDAREVSRRLRDISPHYLLMALLEGIAAAQGVTHILAVSAKRHPAYRPSREEAMVRSYDDIFRSLGSRTLDSDLHLMTVPHQARPLSDIARSHRARTQHKRLAKQALADAAAARWRTYMPAP